MFGPAIRGELRRPRTRTSAQFPGRRSLRAVGARNSHERFERVDVAGLRPDFLNPAPAIVTAELPGTPIVGEHHVNDRAQPYLALRVGDGRERFAPSVEVAFHEVGRADEELLPVAAAELEDARVLEVPPDDRTHANRLTSARHARSDRAHATHDEVDRHASGRGTIEGRDGSGIDDGVALDDD